MAVGSALILLAVLRSIPQQSERRGRHHHGGRHRARHARRPAPSVDLDLWRNGHFALANLVGCLSVAAMFSSLLCGPLLLTTVWGYSILQAGFLVTPGAIIASAAAISVGRLRKPARQRAAVPLGMALFAVNGVALWAALGASRDLLAWLGIGLFGGAGLGMALTGLNTVAALSTPPARFATGTGLHNASRQVGGAFGAAGVAVVLSGIGVRDVTAYRTVFLMGGVAGAVAAVLGLLLLSRAQPAGAAHPRSVLRQRAKEKT
jgi:MFS family permease